MGASGPDCPTSTHGNGDERRVDERRVMSVARQMRRALARKAAKKFVREKHADLDRDIRKRLITDLAERAFHETPVHMFERHVIERPRIIIPQVEIQTPEGFEHRAHDADGAGQEPLIVLTDQ